MKADFFCSQIRHFQSGITLELHSAEILGSCYSGQKSHIDQVVDQNIETWTFLGVYREMIEEERGDSSQSIKCESLRTKFMEFVFGLL